MTPSTPFPCRFVFVVVHANVTEIPSIIGIWGDVVAHSCHYPSNYWKREQIFCSGSRSTYIVVTHARFNLEFDPIRCNSVNQPQIHIICLLSKTFSPNNHCSAHRMVSQPSWLWVLALAAHNRKNEVRRVGLDDGLKQYKQWAPSQPPFLQTSACIRFVQLRHTWQVFHQASITLHVSHPVAKPNRCINTTVVFSGSFMFVNLLE